MLWLVQSLDHIQFEHLQYVRFWIGMFCWWWRGLFNSVKGISFVHPSSTVLIVKSASAL